MFSVRGLKKVPAKVVRKKNYSSRLENWFVKSYAFCSFASLRKEKTQITLADFWFCEKSDGKHSFDVLIS